MLISTAFAQAAAPAGTSEGLLGSVTSMLPLILMFAVLYFIMIRPQMKRQKEQKTMIDALAKGDEVVTSGGLVGRIARLDDNYVRLEVASGTEIKLQRGAIVQVLPKGEYAK